MATDFTSLNKAAQVLIDAATKPLTAQVTTLTAQLATATTSLTANTATITDLKAQIATLTAQVQDEAEMFFWFKGSTNPVYVYNPIAGTKRLISASEWKLIKAVTPTATVVVLADADVTAIPTVK